MRMTIGFGAAALLAACGGGSGANVAAPATDPAAKAALDRVTALPDRQRNVAFVRAILDSSEPCQCVSESQRLADFQGLPTWEARCTNGPRYLIQLRGDMFLVTRSTRG